MPSTPRWSSTRRLLALAAVLGILAAACSNADSEDSEKESTSSTSTTSATDGSTSSANVPGVTADEIRFSVIGTRSNNPLGTCILDCYLEGINAYFDYRNSEGGVDGRKLVVAKELDDELGQNQVRALEVVTANDTFATFNASQIASGFGDLANAGIPLYVWPIQPAEMAGRSSVFGQREVLCISCTRRADAYGAELAGAKKVASVGYGISDASKLCAQSAADSIEQYGDDIAGARSVYLNDNLAFGLPNGIGPEVTAMKDAGVEFIIGCLDLNGMKTLAQELQRQGMRDSVTLMHSNTYDQAFVTEAGDLFDGDIVLVTFRPFEASSNDSLAAYKKWMEKSDSALTELAMVGWINADLAYQGIKAAGPGFDRQKVIDATNRMTDYTAGGLTQPIDWSRQHEAPTQDDPATHGPAQDCAALVKVVDGEFQLVGEDSEPFTCWPGTTRDWSDPTAMAFG